MEHQPWRKPAVLISTAVIGVVCLLIGFTLGYNKVISDRISNALLNRDLTAAQARVTLLEGELIDSRLNVDVQREASNALREEMTQEHENSARLQEEMTFYKGLMSPSSLAKGLQVAELELAPSVDDGIYSYRLLLTQVALRRSFIAGEVRFDVIGGFGEAADQADFDQADKPESVLSLTELTELKTYPLRFRFRYFQDLAGQITFPEGFVPTRVLVTANQNGKESLQVTFPWPQNI